MYVHVYIQFTSGYVYMHIICTTCAIMYTCESHVHVRVYTSNAPDGLQIRFVYEGTNNCERGLFFCGRGRPRCRHLHGRRRCDSRCDSRCSVLDLCRRRRRHLERSSVVSRVWRSTNTFRHSLFLLCEVHDATEVRLLKPDNHSITATKVAFGKAVAFRDGPSV